MREEGVVAGGEGGGWWWVVGGWWELGDLEGGGFEEVGAGGVRGFSGLVGWVFEGRVGAGIPDLGVVLFELGDYGFEAGFAVGWGGSFDSAGVRRRGG